MIWAVVQPQVKKNLGIDPQEDPEGAEAAFLERINGPAVETGRQAMWRALAGFFPEHRTALETLMGRLDRANNRIGERIRLMGDDLDKMLDEEIDREMKTLQKKISEGMVAG